jgi:hypothetical protein
MYNVVLYQKVFEDGRIGWEYTILADNGVILADNGVMYDSYSEEYNGIDQPLALRDALDAIEEYFSEVIPNEIKEG